MLTVLLNIVPPIASLVYMFFTYRKSHSISTTIFSTIIVLTLSHFTLTSLAILVGGVIGLALVPVFQVLCFYGAYKIKFLWLKRGDEVSGVRTSSTRSHAGSVLITIGILMFLSPFLAGIIPGLFGLAEFFAFSGISLIGIPVALIGYFVRGR